MNLILYQVLLIPLSILSFILFTLCFILFLFLQIAIKPRATYSKWLMRCKNVVNIQIYQTTDIGKGCSKISFDGCKFQTTVIIKKLPL